MTHTTDAPQVIRTRFLVIGSGVAGLWTACQLSRHGPTVVATKRRMSDTSTNYAQGGIAVALCPEDSPELHAQDTIAAGAGLCDEIAVKILTREGPQRVMELINLGAEFDRYGGELHCRREAAHGERRIIHAHGDATGAEIQRALGVAVAQRQNITVMEFTQAVRLLMLDGEVVGADLVRVHEGCRLRILADATVIASGGFGALYTFTTSPPVAVGDGMALAFRAGAPLQDMEFVQFHPTALCTDEMPVPLISEAVRGEGAVLLNSAREPFMLKYHPLGDLAPRDIVSRSEFTEMQRLGVDYCLLDLSPIPPEQMNTNFPHIVEMLHARGFKVPEELVPVRPVAHYTMGGIATDLHARSELRRLYAVGECSCTGVHGANRLASNSLLEGLVFGSRAAASAGREDRLAQAAVSEVAGWQWGPLPAAPPEVVPEIRTLMWAHVGIMRQGERLKRAVKRLGELVESSGQATQLSAPLEAVDAANMALVGYLTAMGALLRTESRGGHYRTDMPEPKDEWQCHLRVSHTPDNGVEFRRVPVGWQESNGTPCIR
jgi:L-aspartate oxidase